MKLIAFLGPSKPRKLPVRCTVLPPARQGDVWRALRQKPDAIALIDGVFESQPSVWHHEILDALDAGVPVYGGASMGALRAAELHQRGMVGVGQIFRWYRDGEILDDAEVALLHADAEHGYRGLTVPQVNVRWSAAVAVQKRLITQARARAMVEKSAAIFYQERTPDRLALPFPLLDLKSLDAAETLQQAARAKRWPATARQPAPSSLVRMARLAATGAAPNEDPDAALRRALLAGWARELGLRPEPPELEEAERRWRTELRAKTRKALLDKTGLDEDQFLRLLEDRALERLVLDHAHRFLNDGPHKF
jgi:hypothetical protein